MGWQSLRKLLNIKLKKSFFGWYREATQRTCLVKIRQLEQEHTTQLQQSRTLAILTKIRDRQDIKMKFASF